MRPGVKKKWFALVCARFFGSCRISIMHAEFWFATVKADCRTPINDLNINIRNDVRVGDEWNV